MKIVLFWICIISYNCLFSQILTRIDNKEYEISFYKSNEILKLEDRNEIVEFKLSIKNDCTYEIINYGKSRLDSRNAINKLLKGKTLTKIIKSIYLVEPKFSEKFKKPYSDKVEIIQADQYCNLLKGVILYYNESFKDIF